MRQCEGYELGSGISKFIPTIGQYTKSPVLDYKVGVWVSQSCCNKLPLSGLKQHSFIFSELWTSEVPSQSHLVKCHTPLETLGENLFPCLFQLLQLYSLHSLAHSPFLHHQSQQHIPLASAITLLSSVSNLPLPPSYEDTCDQDNLTISRSLV